MDSEEDLIKESVEYIREYARITNWLEGNQLDTCELIDMVEEAHRTIEALCKRIAVRRGRLELESLDTDPKADEAMTKTRQALDHLVEASVLLNSARSSAKTLHRSRRKSRRMVLQRKAVRCAVSIASHPRQVRRIARQIMTLAGIDQPSERALTDLIREMKEMANSLS